MGGAKSHCVYVTVAGAFVHMCMSTGVKKAARGSGTVRGYLAICCETVLTQDTASSCNRAASVQGTGQKGFQVFTCTGRCRSHTTREIIQVRI